MPSAGSGQICDPALPARLWTGATVPERQGGHGIPARTAWKATQTGTASGSCSEGSAASAPRPGRTTEPVPRPGKGKPGTSNPGPVVDIGVDGQLVKVGAVCQSPIDGRLS